MPKLNVTVEGRVFTIELPAMMPNSKTLEAVVDGKPMQVLLDGERKGELLIVNGRPYEVDYDRDFRWLKTSRGLHTLDILDLEAVVLRPATGDGRVKAPIPGLISNIGVEPGEQVEIGQPLMILEAMKMQNELRAPMTGIIKSIHVEIGQVVARTQVLAEIVALGSAV